MTRTKLKSLGSVFVGEKFVFRASEILGPGARKSPFEGQVLTVAGFMPASYVSRVVLKTSDGKELLLRLDCVEKALSTRPGQKTQ